MKFSMFVLRRFIALDESPKNRACLSPDRAVYDRRMSKVKGPDGVEIEVPDGCTFLYGPDRRMAAIPPGGVGRFGPDGRMVGIPNGLVGVADDAGRMQPVKATDTDETDAES